ncbi:hypothetical protein [Leptospira bandrabouensis]|uniref:Uncharacterized protein n=1 Tax=Leptospira bandrabouensis TaxID=2484903 RepID=A0A6H3NWL4_9LEPT|nr:hypothetical protein [Leptospira bandrabouensis]MCG6154073.1 hypothetical protein [Leptospira bandrabouensis]TGN09101.1 hypothetical protein EHR07_02080 [Leptospira bandrabouensis]TGN14021.1 hypothetical protein EHR08_10260 [Leptospira bandrabouensis]
MTININKLQSFFSAIENDSIETRVYDGAEKNLIIIFKYPNAFRPNTIFEDQNLETIIRFRISEKENSIASSLKKITIEINFWKRLLGENLGKYSDTFQKRENEKYPLNMNITDFYYDSFSNQIFLDDSPKNAQNLIQYLLNYHFRNTKLISGLTIRYKFYKKKKLTELYRTLLDMSLFLEYIFFGSKTTIIQERNKRNFDILDQRKSEAKKEKEEGREIEILGISGMKIKLWDLSSYSFLQILIFLISNHFNFSIFKEIYNSTLLSLFYVILTFNLYSLLIRRLINRLSNFLWKNYTKNAFKIIEF